MEMPLIAAPTAKWSQFLRAISVLPKAPVNTGVRIFTLSVAPYAVAVSTTGKVAWSGSDSIPAAPMAYPMMLMWE
jgi:hypothetical protein